MLMTMLGPARDEVTGSGIDYRTRSFMNYTADQIKKNEMGETCGTYPKWEGHIHSFSGET